MTIPDYQTIMLPLLKFACDGQEHRFRDSVNTLADDFQLTEEERKELLPSGQQPLFPNRVGWARLYLVKAGLLEATRRGYFKITEQGKEALSQNPSKIDKYFLMQFPEFVKAWEQQKGKRDYKKIQPTPAETTPEESLESAFQELQESLASELLDTIKNCSPEFFERLVIDVLIKMGYSATQSGVELRMLKRWFTPEEAEMAIFPYTLKLNQIELLFIGHNISRPHIPRSVPEKSVSTNALDSIRKFAQIDNN